MTFNLGGLAGGFNQGLELGRNIKALVNEDEIAKVRAQGIAEARAMQAAGTPGVVDNGDIKNLTSNPQASPDPAAVPVNTNLAASPAMQGVGQPAVSENGISTAPVAAPQSTPSDALSSTPLSSADPAAAPAGGVTIKGGKRFMVGDAGFDDLASAQAHAKSQAPDLYEIMRKTMVPKMQEVYLQQGDLDKAAAIEKWSTDADGRAYMKKYGQAVLASQAGDWDKTIDLMHDLHKGFNDGFTISDKADVKDASGNMIGKKVTYKNDQTGETRTEVMDPKALVMMGLPGLSPEKAFDMTYATQKAADTATAKEAADNRNDARTAARQAANSAAVTAREGVLQDKKFAQDKEMETIKATNKMEEKKTESQLEAAGVAPKLRAKVGAQVALLRESGMSDDDVKEAIPTLVGIEPNYKKTTNPTERRAIVTTELLKNPLFTSKKPAEQNAMVDQYISIIDGAKEAKPAAAAPTPVAPAAAGGVRARPAAAAAPAPLMVYDPVTKQMVPSQRR